MYLLKVNDPGSKQSPNPNYNPNILTATSVADVWPGLTTQMDTPLDPISGTACEDPAGGGTPDPSDPAVPELLQVDKAAILAGAIRHRPPGDDPRRLHQLTEQRPRHGCGSRT